MGAFPWQGLTLGEEEGSVMDQAQELTCCQRSYRREVIPREARRREGYPRGTYEVLYGRLVWGILSQETVSGELILEGLCICIVPCTAFSIGPDLMSPGT